MTDVKNHQIAIVGGGTAGITAAAHLKRRIPSADIAIFDPAKRHFYQPIFTLVGGGASAYETSFRSMASVIPPGVTFYNEAITSFIPSDNRIATTSGAYRYEHMIVAPGIQLDWSHIAGLTEEVIGSHNICSNYSADKVERTWQVIDSFTGGTAIFTFPATLIKCAGAPQKIMWLMEHLLERKGIRAKANIIFATAGAKLFGVDKYRLALETLATNRGIKLLFGHNLTSIKSAEKIAVFTTSDGNKVEIPFDMIHVTPPMSAPDVIKSSPLAGAGGWVDVDKATTRHVKWKNVFSIGDASSLPTSKTGAAIRKQVPVLLDHLTADIRGEKGWAEYDGYTSCPLVTGYGRLILAEFDYSGKPCETFPFDQSKERLSMYLLKKYVLPRLYWQGMLKGFA